MGEIALSFLILLKRDNEIQIIGSAFVFCAFVMLHDRILSLNFKNPSLFMESYSVIGKKRTFSHKLLQLIYNNYIIIDINKYFIL